MLNYIFTAINPNIKPTIFPKVGNLPLYNEFDSGISSPETMYNIAPAANVRQIEITSSDISPIIFPTNAPIPVVIPDNIT